MTRYTLHFEWGQGRRDAAPHAHLLLAGDLADAKLEAAILYACVDAPAPPPGYRIVAGRRVAYRYPELRARRSGGQTAAR